MKIITLLFNEKEKTCLMKCGNKIMEIYTYSEGEVALNVIQKLSSWGIIEINVEYE